MDAQSLNKTPKQETRKEDKSVDDVKANVTNSKPKVQQDEVANKMLEKDREIQRLKKELEDSKKEVVETDKYGIKERNTNGDYAMILIGLDENGQKVFKQSNKLTDADIERRNDYIKQIKQLNARKY